MAAATPVTTSGTANGAEAKASRPAAGLTRVQKLAVFLLMISEENAARIMKGLDDYELEAVCSEMAKFPSISYELQQDIQRELGQIALSASMAVSGGVGRVGQLLEKSVGAIRTSDILRRVSPSRAPVAAMQGIIDMDTRNIFNLLRHEQVQTIALVVSYLPQERAAQVLALFRPELHEQVIERLATLTPTSIEVAESVAAELQRRIGGDRRRAINQTGGLKVAAQVLNALPKTISKAVLASLQERNPELANAVGKNMFTFEELERLDTKALQSILQEVDTHTLAVALKTASESVKTALLGAISRRASETVREEIEFMGPLKLSEIEGAQASIIEVVRKLESEGELDLSDLHAKGRS